MSAFRKEEVKKKAKKAGKTISEYILTALGLMDEYISEDELLARVKRAEDNYKKGKTKKLKSLADLMKK